MSKESEAEPVPREALRMSRGEAYLEADAAMWLATGDVLVDERNPASLLARELDRKVPPERYAEWLDSASEALGGKTPRELLHQDELGPVLELLRSLPDRAEPVALRPGGNDR